jgi:hypothetical protein
MSDRNRPEAEIDEPPFRLSEIFALARPRPAASDAAVMRGSPGRRSRTRTRFLGASPMCEPSTLSVREVAMHARYTRLFTDSNGTSRFEDAGIPLEPGFAVPPAEPLYSAEFSPAAAAFWVGAPAAWKGDAPHPAPRRMIFVTVRGEYEVEASDRTTRRFPPGSVLLLEDTSGAGHSTKIIGADDCIVLAVALSTRAA